MSLYLAQALMTDRNSILIQKYTGRGRSCERTAIRSVEMHQYRIVVFVGVPEPFRLSLNVGLT